MKFETWKSGTLEADAELAKLKGEMMQSHVQQNENGKTQPAPDQKQGPQKRKASLQELSETAVKAAQEATAKKQATTQLIEDDNDDAKSSLFDPEGGSEHDKDKDSDYDYDHGGGSPVRTRGRGRGRGKAKPKSQPKEPKKKK